MINYHAILPLLQHMFVPIANQSPINRDAGIYNRGCLNTHALSWFLDYLGLAFDIGSHKWMNIHRTNMMDGGGCSPAIIVCEHALTLKKRL